MSKYLTLISVFFIFTCQAQNWQPISVDSEGDFFCIEFSGSTQGIISKTFGNTFTTSDGGETWNESDEQGFQDIKFLNENFGLGASAVTESIARTYDGGQTWQSVTPPTSNSLWAAAIVSADVMYVGGTGGVVWKSINGGNSFFAVNNIQQGISPIVRGLFFASEDVGFAAVSTGLFKTEDGGDTWVQAISGFFNAVTFETELIGWAVGPSGSIYKTVNGGDTWEESVFEEVSLLEEINFYDELHGIAVGYNGKILYTSDGGNSWVLQESGTESRLFDVWMLSPSSAIVVGEDGTILMNTDLTLSSDAALNEQSEVIVYPLPANGTLNIQSPEVMESIELLDLTGKRVLANNSIFEFEHVIRGDFAPGAYVLRVNLINGNTITKRVVY